VPRFGWTTVLGVVCLGLAVIFLLIQPGLYPWTTVAFAVTLLLEDARSRAERRRRFLANEQARGRAEALRIEARNMLTTGRWRAWVCAELERVAGAEAVAQVLAERAAQEKRLRPVRGMRLVLLCAAVFTITVCLVVLLSG